MQAKLRSARAAVAALFFLNGALFATWVSRIPSIEASHALGHRGFGLALLTAALGAIIAMPLTGVIIARIGSARASRFAALLYCAALPCLAWAATPIALAAALLVFGAAHGALDVAMNADAVAVEKRYGRTIMASFHAFFSVGGLVGAAVGIAAAKSGAGPLEHFLVTAPLLGVIAWWAFPRLLPAEPTVAAARPARRKTCVALDLRLVGLGAIAFCCMLAEGAMADWSALYLKETLHASEAFAATGYAAFSLTMVAGRVFGDGWTRRFGPETLVRAGGIATSAGMAGALLIPHPFVALAGFALIGAGCATIVPLVFSAAGRSRSGADGLALATVTTLGYFGFLAGPPAIGFIAEAVGLHGALALIVVSGLAVFALAPLVGSAPAPRASPASQTAELMKSQASAMHTPHGAHPTCAVCTSTATS